jgi:ATP-dependent 26S proteasome regulatory subunit
MARLLQPSMVILEDVDLVAEERDRQQPGCTPLLLELLNEMDGLGDDADVIFLLTSNRRRPVGAGLAARPGRVDLAGEAPYRTQLPPSPVRAVWPGPYLGLDADGLDRLIQQTEGVSSAFLRELLRKAALLAVLPTGGSGDRDGVTDTIIVTDQQLDQAMHELVLDGGEPTKRLSAPPADRLGPSRPVR